MSVARKTAMIRHGKGGEDRMLPLGPRVLYWLERYLRLVRPELLLDIKEQAVFLNDYGEPFRDSKLGDEVERSMMHAGIEAAGSCHLLRHACATHMLGNGAELRFIQALLGNADPGATQLDTHVCIRNLAEIHAATHPAKLTGREPRDGAEAADSAEPV